MAVLRFSALVYYIKFLIFAVGMTISSAFITPVLLLRPRNVINYKIASSVFRWITRVLGVRWHLCGAENLAKEQTCVIVVNHQSSIDIIGISEIFHIIGKCALLGRIAVMFLGPAGLAAWLCGTIFIDTSSADRGKQKMKDAMEKLKMEKTKLLIFPEGHRNYSGGINTFKKGAFYLAIQAQVPILPVVFSSYRAFMRRSEKVFESGDVIIEALSEIQTKGMKIEDIDWLMEKTRDLMIKKHDELNEILAKKYI